MFCIMQGSRLSLYVHTIYSVVMVGCVADFYCFPCISPCNYRRQMDSGRQNQNKPQIPISTQGNVIRFALWTDSSPQLHSWFI